MSLSGILESPLYCSCRIHDSTDRSDIYLLVPRSYIIGLGNYTSGELVFSDKKSPNYGVHNIKNRWFKFVGDTVIISWLPNHASERSTDRVSSSDVTRNQVSHFNQDTVSSSFAYVSSRPWCELSPDNICRWARPEYSITHFIGIMTPHHDRV